MCSIAASEVQCPLVLEVSEGQCPLFLVSARPIHSNAVHAQSLSSWAHSVPPHPPPFKWAPPVCATNVIVADWGGGVDCGCTGLPDGRKDFSHIVSVTIPLRLGVYNKMVMATPLPLSNQTWLQYYERNVKSSSVNSLDINKLINQNIRKRSLNVSTAFTLACVSPMGKNPCSWGWQQYQNSLSRKWGRPRSENWWQYKPEAQHSNGGSATSRLPPTFLSQSSSETAKWQWMRAGFCLMWRPIAWFYINLVSLTTWLSKWSSLAEKNQACRRHKERHGWLTSLFGSLKLRTTNKPQ